MIEKATERTKGFEVDCVEVRDDPELREIAPTGLAGYRVGRWSA